MRSVLLISLLIGSVFGCSQTRDPRSDFRRMDWLVGTWQGQTDGRLFYEQWIRVSDTELDNTSYVFCNGDTLREGHSKIQLHDGRIVYTSDNQVWDLQTLSDSVIVFQNASRGERFTFQKSAAGEWRASLKYPQRQSDYVLTRTLALSALLQQKPRSLTGYFEGFIEFRNRRLSTSIRFASEQGRQTAAVTTPDNLQLNMPCDDVCYDTPYLRLRLRDGTQQLELRAIVQGGEIDGRLEGEIPATIRLKRSTDKRQSPAYRVISLQVPNGEVVLPADLYLPDRAKPAGVVVMIPGSGNHVKEEYNGWADLLASRGMAVLTYSKRDVSSTNGLRIRQASSDIVLPGKLESDIAALVRMLKNRTDIDPGKIGLLGFSQGAVLAPVVASGDPDIAFVVAVSGNATTDKEFVINQSVNRLKQRGIGEPAISETIATWEALFQYARSRKGGDRLQERLDAAYQKGYGQFSLPRQIPGEDEIRYLSTWNSFEHDPAPFWQKLRVPAYVVYGGRDMFIPVDRSVAILEGLYKDRPSLLTLRLYPEADHFIKNPIDPNNFDFPRYADRYVDDLVAWIEARVK